uniref:ERCC4 domain-containing protein n=1 Tax=viral metagenome TaxID=1070528 RepID=A0A6C0I0M6_9ZZZZ
MQFIIDNREHTLIESCKRYIESIEKKITVDVQTLPLGDAIIRKQDNDIVCIERKTIDDLLASIKDGRYEEQSHRLSNASGLHIHNVLYIIEGIFRSANDKKLVYSTMTSLNIFKGFSIMRTDNVNETAQFLVTMCDKIGRDFEKGKIPKYYSVSTNENIVEGTETSLIASYSTVVKKVKKENLTTANMVEIVLCQIPGISSKTAAAIIAKNKADGGGSLLQLLKCLENNPAYLDDILLETGRKMNKNCSAKILEFLCKH